MKRWIVLLALGVPYVVIQDSYSANYFLYHNQEFIKTCNQDQDYCEDQAKALNDAHEWRTQTIEPEDSTPTPTHQEEPKVTDPYKY